MSPDQSLGRLAERYGISASYRDFSGQEHATSAETQRTLLRASGVMADNDAMVQDALAHADAAVSARRCPDELIIQSKLPYQLPIDFSGHWQINCTETAEVVAEGRGQGQIMLPPLQSGIYDLVFSGDGHTESTTLLVAPNRSPSVTDVSGIARHWGLNAALYGLRSGRNIGLGDFEDLACLGEVLAQRGASFLGINPVHALGCRATDVISPYSPSHREMLNTAHIALDGIPGLELSELVPSSQILASICNQEVEWPPIVDYQACKRIHDKGLMELFSTFMAKSNSSEKEAFDQANATSNQSLNEFGLFEAISESHGADWRHWPLEFQQKNPASLRSFKENAADRIGFHKWLQWVAERQLSCAHTRSRQAGLALGLYLDLAVGSRRGGAESWCNRDVIAQQVSLGAPPDHLSPQGQNWQLAAMAPHRLKADKYAAFQRVLRSTMRHAGLVRIDHVLGMNRSFWIPDDGSPGAYVTQPFDALIAVLKIEAERAGTVVIGEDLGLVPAGFRDRIRSHGFYGYSVLQFEKDESGAIRNPAENDSQVLACVGTHDTPTLQGFIEGRDIDWWTKLGWIDQDTSTKAHRVRAREVASITALTSPTSTEQDLPLGSAVHSSLAQSPAAMVSIQLDDVLGHLDAQNIPGTILEHPNWCRRYTTPIQDFSTHPGLHDIANIMQRNGRCIADSVELKDND